MKLKLLIVITVLAVIGIVVIAVVKKSNSVPEKPEITEVTTDVQVEIKPEKDSQISVQKELNKHEEFGTADRNTIYHLNDDEKFKAEIDSVFRSVPGFKPH